MLCKEVVLSIKGWSYERFFIRSQDTSNHIKLCQVKRRIKMCGVAHAGHGALGHIAPDALFSSSHDANVLTRNDNMYDIATIATLLEIINQTNGSKLKAVPNSERVRPFAVNRCNLQHVTAVSDFFVANGPWFGLWGGSSFQPERGWDWSCSVHTHKQLMIYQSSALRVYALHGSMLAN